MLSLQEGNLCQTACTPPFPLTTIGSSESHTLSDPQEKKKSQETKGHVGVLLGSVILGIRDEKGASRTAGDMAYGFLVHSMPSWPWTAERS